MNQRQAYELARQTMDEHGLTDWNFGFDNATRRLGVTIFRTRRIQLSKTFVALNDLSKVHQVILHEVAHALCPPGARHSNVWKQKALQIGCMEASSTTTSIQPPSRYITSCPNGHTGGARRFSTQRRSCGKCCRKFDERYLVTYTLNPEYKKAS